MSRRDIYHNTVKSALQKAGWRITHDPFPLEIGRKRLSIDLSAERLISASRETEEILVEVKSFVGQSDVSDLEKALGQYVLYQQILQDMNVDRKLFLAIPSLTYKSVFKIEIGELLLRNKILNLIVFDQQTESIVQWLPT